MLACALETDECPAACKGSSTEPTEPGATERPDAKGDLDVSISDYSSSIKSVPAVGTVIFNTLELSSSEDVTLYGVNLSREGLSSKSDVKGVWFEKNGVRISSKGNVNTDGSVSITFNNGFKVKKSESIDLVVQLEASVGAQIAFRITDVDSSAKNVSVNNKVTTTYQTASYTVASTTFSRNGGLTGATYQMGEQSSYILGQFSIANDSPSADDKDIKIQSLVLRNGGSADLSNLRNVKVYRDSKVVSSEVTVDSKNLTIVLNDTIESGRKAIYTIEAEITYVDAASEDYQLSLSKVEDLVAVEKTTNFRTTNTVLSGTTADNYKTLAQYIVKGGKMLFTNQTGFPTTVDAGQGYTDVVLAEGTLTVTEPIVLDTLTLPATTISGVAVDIADVINRVTLEIGGSRYVGTLNSNNVVFNTEFYINKTATIRVLANVKSTAADNATFKLDPIRGARFADGYYQNNDANFVLDNDIAGVITPATLNVKSSTFNLVKTSNKSEITVVKDDSTSFVFYEGTLSNKLSSTVTVNTVSLIGT
jgi:hypothetical protein